MAKILIIDDDKAVVESTADMLKSFEFNVITATDGRRDLNLQTSRDLTLLSLTG